MARRGLTGVLLVGGASTRFGSPKAYARIDGETFAARAWRVLGEACDERFAVGKRGQLELPFDILDDGVDVRAPLAGVVRGLRAARHEVAVFLPVDCPSVTVDVLQSLGDACRGAAVPQTGPLPGAYARSTLPVLERNLTHGKLALKDALPELDVVTLQLGEELLRDVDTPQELRSTG